MSQQVKGLNIRMWSPDEWRLIRKVRHIILTKLAILVTVSLCSLAWADEPVPLTPPPATASPVRPQPGTLAPVKKETSLVATDPYVPPTADDRAEWVIRRTIGWRGMLAGAVNSGYQTWRNSPEEWGGTWNGFGKRMGTRQAKSLMAGSMEASLGALWGEDPRYFQSGAPGFGPRLKHAVSSAFLTYRRDGSRDLAWARFISIPAARSIASTWYPDTEKEWWKMSVSPLGTGIGGKVFSNILREFMPDIGKKFRRGGKNQDQQPDFSTGR